MRRGLLATCAVWLTIAACGGGGTPAVEPQPTPVPGNVLVIVLDDVGVDKVSVYAEHPLAPPTPNLDALAANGVLFRRAYAQPWCSPSRACLLTGRYSFRTGVGNPIRQSSPDYALPDEEVTLPEVLELARPGLVDTAAIGKWHLTSIATGDVLNPNNQGFAWFEGTPGNFAGQSYYQHTKLTNGVLSTSYDYATTEQVDDALWRIPQMHAPWFLYLAFNAAHEPFHAPPAYLHSYALSGDPNDTSFEHVSATVEAMDTEIGRLLAGIDPAVRANTTIFVMGDNGSLASVIAPPWHGAGKGSLSETGVRVPLIVSGRDVAQPGRESDALVHIVDLFATVGELFGVDVATEMPDARPIDSLSFAPLLRDPNATGARTRIYSDAFSPNGLGPYNAKKRMLSDGRWKLIETVGSPDRFYDLSSGPFDDEDLLLEPPLSVEQQAALDALKLEIGELAGP